jgi:hypothetical protein
MTMCSGCWSAGTEAGSQLHWRQPGSSHRQGAEVRVMKQLPSSVYLLVHLQHNVDMARHLTAPAAGTKLIPLILLATVGVITMIMTSMTRGYPADS